jgi:membrane-associated phospholipid phosphatase
VEDARVTAGTDLSADRAFADRVARTVTEVFAPAVLAAAMPIIISLHAAVPFAAGLGWGLLGALFSSLIPYAFVWFGVRRGRFTDHHLGIRQQRGRPVALGLVSVLAGLAILWLAGAPRQLLTMIVVMFVVLLAIGAINQVWKLSAHAAVNAGSVSVLTMVFGPLLLAAIPIVVAVGWSRVRLADHTASQVAAGSVVGAILAAVIFGVLR